MNDMFLFYIYTDMIDNDIIIIIIIIFVQLIIQ